MCLNTAYMKDFSLQERREIPTEGIAQDVPITRYNVMTQDMFLISDDHMNHKDKTSSG